MSDFRNIVRVDPVTDTCSNWNVENTALDQMSFNANRFRLIYFARLTSHFNDNTVPTTFTGAGVRTPIGNPNPLVWPQATRFNLFNVDHTNPSLVQFKYTGPEPRWFNVSVTGTVRKSSGTAQTNTFGFQMALSDDSGVTWQPIGVEFKADCTTDIYDTLTVTGAVYLEQNWSIIPVIRNFDGTDPILVENFVINAVEDPAYVWGAHV